jgi:hypothetical protein
MPTRESQQLRMSIQCRAARQYNEALTWRCWSERLREWRRVNHIRTPQEQELLQLLLRKLFVRPEEDGCNTAKERQ